MKHQPLALFILLLAAALAACAPRFDPDRSAQRFFDRGRDHILDSLEDQKATPAQLDQARAILDRHGQSVPNEIATALRDHRSLLQAITAGEDSSALLTQEDKFRASHLASVRAIGSMHEELQSAVGKSLWDATAAHMRERTARYFRD